MSLRAGLGDFMSIICFKAVIKGVEEVLGKEGAAAVFIQAGRARGKQLAEQHGLSGKKTPAAEMAKLLDAALGVDGTKLCLVKEVKETNGTFLIKTQETVCSAGEASGSSHACCYTMGALLGFLEAVTGTSMRCKQVAFATGGADSDDFEFSPA